MSDWWNQPMTAGPEPGDAETSADDRTRCPWCSAVAAPNLTYCPSCGAVMAQLDSLGGVVIPGVTDVDRNLSDPSLVASSLGSQARMNTLNAVSSAAGPTAGLAAAAMMLARDSAAGMFREAPRPEQVGRPSQAALDMATRLRAGEGAAGENTSAAPSEQREPLWTEPKDPA